MTIAIVFVTLVRSFKGTKSHQKAPLQAGASAAALSRGSTSWPGHARGASAGPARLRLRGLERQIEGRLNLAPLSKHEAVFQRNIGVLRALAGVAKGVERPAIEDIGAFPIAVPFRECRLHRPGADARGENIIGCEFVGYPCFLGRALVVAE